MVAIVMGRNYYLLTMSAIQTLLRGSIDYAGLFPPAGLDMATAVTNYARYRAGPSAWALGRFIVPVSGLPELEAQESQLPRNPADHPWRLGVLAGSDLAADLTQIGEFNRRHSEPGRPAITADTVEVKATSEGHIAEIMRVVPPGLQGYIEIPIESDPYPLIATIRRMGGRAKVRTGGVTPEAFPSPANLLRFLHGCVRASVPFKATAGLHHPLRAEYPLTYAPNSPRGAMFGFLNLFLTVTFLRAAMNETEAMRVLEEGSPGAFQADDSGISWRHRRLDLRSLSEARQDGIISFGSCSFTEPIHDLESLQLLEHRTQRA
jgi:hypothetical protein